MAVAPRRFFRSLLAGFFFVLYGLFALPFAVLLSLPFFPRDWGRRAVRFFYRMFVACARITGLYTVEFRGSPGGRAAGPVGEIVVMNHVSLIDICVLLAHIPDAVCIAKASAKRNLFLSAVVRKVFIANDRGGQEVVAEAGGYLRRGVNVVVFPQGTRGGKKLHRGAARLALATGACVRAYHIDYEPVVLAKGQPWWDVGEKNLVIRLEERENIAVDGEPNDYRHAVALTRKIGAAIS